MILFLYTLFYTFNIYVCWTLITNWTILHAVFPLRNQTQGAIRINTSFISLKTLLLILICKYILIGSEEFLNHNIMMVKGSMTDGITLFVLIKARKKKTTLQATRGGRYFSRKTVHCEILNSLR